MEEQDLEEARNILGDLAKDLSNDQLREIRAEIEYLIEAWVDDYERSIFKGKTLRELLGESL